MKKLTLLVLTMQSYDGNLTPANTFSETHNPSANRILNKIFEFALTTPHSSGTNTENRRF